MGMAGLREGLTPPARRGSDPAMRAQVNEPVETSSAATIRSATKADAVPLARVHVASWRETYAGLMPEGVLAGLSVTERAERWLTALDRRDASDGPAVFVAELAGQVVGLASCGGQRTPALGAQGFTAEIGAIYVLRSAQGRGVGSDLMGAMAETLTDRGHRAASLWVLQGNVQARRFYERLGGEIVGHKEDRREGMTLDEVAYGWRGLHRLLVSQQNS